MNEFDKWWEENYMNVSADRTEAEDIYNLGSQSQQAKIDELQKKYDAMYNAFVVADDCRKEWHESYMSARKQRDELQGRIDRVVHILTYTNHASTPLCNELRDILKGNKDEST